MKKTIKIKDNIYEIEADEIHKDIFKVEINNKDYFFLNTESGMEQISKEKVLQTAQLGKSSNVNTSQDDSSEIRAPLTGTISCVWVSPGDKIKKGQKVITLIAMKMENEILASGDGEVMEVFCKKDDVVNKEDILLRLKQ